ncbi:MAG TPA: hypothetical protein VFS16_09550 [Acidimicrobiia bacterium]|nr:hypothetical protein [Acidimicrobiia bacterium]
MASDRTRFDSIEYTVSGPDDVPVRRSCPTYYERWGDGRPAAQAEFEAAKDFYDLLPAWVANLAGTVPPGFGSLRRLVSAGFFVEGATLLHGEGRAMDVDEVTWANAVIRPKDREHASGDPVRVLRYIGLDAICRRHFPVVLDGWYNADHEDHIHVERVGTPLLNKRAESATLFCRATCKLVFGADMAIKGRWDDPLESAMQDALRRTGVNGDPSTDPEAWRAWLYAVARAALDGRTL